MHVIELFDARMMEEAMLTAYSSMTARSWTRVGALLVVAFFCVPLFIALGEQDLRNDEAIYSYSVDRMLETGDWLTPRAIPFDGPFLEKPPLKLWMVAGLIRAGVLPHDEVGLRAVDVVLGIAAFLYVYAIGALLAGPVSGVVSVFVLFAFVPLQIDHGLRSNNMEAALLLAYCGGIYHFIRWESAEGRRRLAHALAVGVFFSLGFMTKFVAVFFLPIVCALAFLFDAKGRPKGLRYVLMDALAATVLILVLCAPWFIWGYLHHGRMLWNVMLGQHVYTRFTGALDPSHLQPWSYYFVTTWRELTRFHLHWLVAAGFAVLLWRAVTGQPRLARLLVIWFIVPMTLISFGTSKLFHYAYPFVPPLALGVGYIVASLVALLTGTEGRDFSLGPLAARTEVLALRTSARGAIAIARRVCVVLGVLALAVALWTIIDGRVIVDLGGSRLTNASIARPLIAGACLLWLGTAPLAMLHAWAVLPLLVVLALPAYEGSISLLRRSNHPLRSMRDCMMEVQHASPAAGRGVYNAAHLRAGHPYFYYLRPVGPWRFADDPVPDEVRKHLLGQKAQFPMLVTQEAFGDVLAAIADGPKRSGDATPAAFNQSSTQPAVAGVMNTDGVIVVLPGPYQRCMAAAVASGWRVAAAVDASGEAIGATR